MFSDQEKTLLRKRVYAVKDIVYAANPTIKKGDRGVIEAFGQASRNPFVKWDNGYRVYADIAVEYRGSIEYILDNLLSSMVKSTDAPCSSYTHLAQAVKAVYDMLDDYVPSTEEHEEELESVLEHMRLLHYGK